MEIRSYRAVFELERRVYRIDTLRLNPGGVPLRGIVYAVGTVLATAVAGRIGPVGLVLGVLPWYVGYLGLPIAAAALFTIVRIEGRPFHLAAWALAVHRMTPRHTTRLGRAPAPRARWRPGRVVFIPDGSDSRLRRLRYRGPGAVLVCCAHDRVDWRRPRSGPGVRRASVTVHPREGGRPLLRPAGLELEPGAVLEVRTVPAS